MMKLIRLIQRKLIIPRGDTGSFNIPAIAAASNSDVAVFTIFDCTTKTKLFQKSIAATSDVLTFEFTHNDTVNLPPGNYVWDIKFYKNPVYADEELVNGEEIDSYYAGYSLPTCEIRETSDNLLMNSSAPSATLTPAQLDIISAALASLSQAVVNTEENVSHYPIIQNNTWYVWDAITNEYVSTNVSANGLVGNGISGISKTGTTGLTDTYTIAFTDGTSATFTVTNGESGVYVGTQEPTNPNVNVWINPDGEGSSVQSMQIHICSAAEYDAQTGVPTISMPDTTTFYLVPGGEANNLYVEWVYTNGAWEQFGSASIDLSGYATVADTVLTSTLSKGRKANTTVGVGSFAFGNNVEASGPHAHAEGAVTTASAIGAHAEGWYTVASGAGAHAEGGFSNAVGITTASGNFSHAEGQHTTASAPGAHSEGLNTIASGSFSHAEGRNNIAKADASHVGGAYNVEDSYSSWPEWVASTSYSIGDKVKVTTTTNNETTVTGYICQTANNDVEFTASKWTVDTYLNFAEIIGNGTTNSARSNARALSWEGNEYLAGDLYVHANSDSSGGSKVATAADTVLETTLSRGRQEGTTVGAGSIAFGSDVIASANYSVAVGIETNALGMASYVEGGQVTAYGRFSHAEGVGGTVQCLLTGDANATVYTVASQINHLYINDIIYLDNKRSKITSIDTTNGTITVTPSFGDALNRTSVWVRHGGAFGDFSHSEGAGTVAASAMQHVSGCFNVVDNNNTYAVIVGNGNSQNGTPSNAYALSWTGDGRYAGDVYVGCNADSSGGTKLAKLTDVTVSDVQVNGTSVVTNGVANVPVANMTTVGAFKTSSFKGFAVDNSGDIIVDFANSAHIKAGASGYKFLVVANQAQATFYGLAKIAGADEKNSALAAGVYTENAKSKISQMLNAPVTVSGTTPTINAMAGVQYVCGECATLDITLPASGCVDVVFESGSTPTALTLTLPTGYTLEWLGGFDDTSLDASCTYEINVRIVGTKCLGVAGKWT